MAIGTSLFLIAVGAILRYAVDATVAGLDIQTAGLILMIIGVVADGSVTRARRSWLDAQGRGTIRASRTPPDDPRSREMAAG